MAEDDVIDFKNSIAKKLIESEKNYHNRKAIQFKGHSYSYQELFERAKKVALLLKTSKESHCLILTDRNFSAYISLLAVLLAGKAYVFLNKKDSVEQLKKTILLTSTSLIISDEQNLMTLREVNHALSEQLNFVCLTNYGDVKHSSNDFHELIYSDGLEYIPPLHAYRDAYLMFTSGSTGEPKGVPISHENLFSFLNTILERIKPTKFDKFSHINELTFDFSVYELFSCWLSGACLCVLPDNYIIGIDKYIKKNQITFWSSVPSLINLLKQLKKLDTGVFNSIRYSVFCGEALTFDIAKLWQQAAPNSVIDNLYGPTEATVAITGYIWDGSNDSGVLPIGMPFNNQQLYLINNRNEEARYGEIGEICLSGSQVCRNYWNNELISTKRFINFNGKRLYKTGDLAYFDSIKGYIYKGRADDQLKINGYRVEKIDIENRIKIILKTDSVAIVAVKKQQSGIVQSLTCFFSNVYFEVKDAIELCRQILPDYMIPTQFIKLDELLLNINGKVDYQSLSRLILSEKGLIKDLM